jgi:hypothetical protein
MLPLWFREPRPPGFEKNICEITERCEAILIKIYQNSEGTEQSFVRLGIFYIKKCHITIEKGIKNCNILLRIGF